MTQARPSTWLRAAPFAVIGLALACSGCRTVKSYAGDRLPRDEVARIVGDVPLNGAPLAVILRKVDSRELGFSESSAEVLPGKHSLLVDCRIRETSSTSRHSLDVEVEAGRSYRLAADSARGMRGCTDVRLESD